MQPTAPCSFPEHPVTVNKKYRAAMIIIIAAENYPERVWSSNQAASLLSPPTSNTLFSPMQSSFPPSLGMALHIATKDIQPLYWLSPIKCLNVNNKTL